MYKSTVPLYTHGCDGKKNTHKNVMLEIPSSGFSIIY